MFVDGDDSGDTAAVDGFSEVFCGAVVETTSKNKQNDIDQLRICKEAVESVMCDVIKVRLKRRIATRSGKGNQPLNIKTAVVLPILKLGLPNFR